MIIQVIVMQGCKEYLEFLLTRRSIRRFRDEPVDDSLLTRILDVARFAPSAKNSQPWEFIIIKDRETIERLSKIHRWSIPLSRSPVGIVVVCNPEESPTSYLVDCANATLYLILAAHAFGLGTVWIQALRNVDEINEVLGIPKGKVPVAIIAMGWPDESPRPRERKPLKEIVYLDRYGKPWKGEKEKE